MERLLEILRNIAVFMLLCETIIHFAPNERYEKFCKPIIALMILAKFLSSLAGTQSFDSLLTENLQYYEEQFYAFESEYKVSQKEFQEQDNVTNKLNDELIIESNSKETLESSVEKIRIEKVEVENVYENP